MLSGVESAIYRQTLPMSKSDGDFERAMREFIDMKELPDIVIELSKGRERNTERLAATRRGRRNQSEEVRYNRVKYTTSIKLDDEASTRS